MITAISPQRFSSPVLRTLSVSLVKFCTGQGFVKLFPRSYSEKGILLIALPPWHSMCFATAIENNVLPVIIVMTTVNVSMKVVFFILILIISSP